MLITFVTLGSVNHSKSNYKVKGNVKITMYKEKIIGCIILDRIEIKGFQLHLK